MDYYLMSAGSSPNQDYRWWRIDEYDHLQSAEPPLIRELTAPKARLSDWLDDEGVSIVLGQCDKLPGLLVTSLPANRCDYQQRPIRNYFGCQATSSEDEQAIRTLTASALTDHQLLGEALNRAVTSRAKSASNEPGFQFTWRLWEEALHGVLLSQVNKSIDNSTKMTKKWGDRLRFRIAKNSPDRRNELVNYLLNDELPLPEHLKVILLITRYKDSGFFWSHQSEIGAVLSELENSIEWREESLMGRLKKLFP